MLDAEGRALRDDLLRTFARGAEDPLDDSRFDELARRVFAYAFDRIPAYAGYCRARGADPGSVARWTDIPAVPTAAFKELRLLARGATAEAVFRTSGTTRGPERRGEHHVADLGLYRASLRAGFRAGLIPDDARLRFLSLMPSSAALPDSSLAFMIQDVLEAFGAPGSATLAHASGLDDEALDRAVDAAIADAVPVLLLGTSAAFVHWLERLRERGARRLPPGSRIMDTGGFKGRGRELDPAELRRASGELLGVPDAACVNEYGMTEMLSQLYDTALRDSLGLPPVPGEAAGAGAEPRRSPDRDAPARPQEATWPEGDPRWKAAPPWVRSVAVDPETLDPLPSGASGLLRHFDLANVGSVPAIQTEDLGRVDGRRLVLEGRAAGAAPRGCSIAMDLLLGEAG